MKFKVVNRLEVNYRTLEEQEAILQANEDFFRSQGWIK